MRPDVALTNDKHFEFHSNNEDETRKLGELLAEVIESGTVIALVGNLGAGKTRLVQAVAIAMGVDRREVTSPTFILIQEYDGRLPIYHCDTYRLRDEDDFLELGADEIMNSEGVCFIEWADRVENVLPDDLVRIEIEITGKESRTFHISSTGPKSNKIVKQLQQRTIADN